MKRFYARTNHRLIAKSIGNQEARQRLIRRLMKKKHTPGAPGEAMPNPSPEADYVISKPWKESKNARGWMLEQEDDPLFKVGKAIIILIRRSLTVSLGFCLEPQEARPVTAAQSGRRTLKRRHRQHRYREGRQDINSQDTAHQLHNIRPPAAFRRYQYPHPA